jgi:hypothetical protein
MARVVAHMQVAAVTLVLDLVVLVTVDQEVVVTEQVVVAVLEEMVEIVILHQTAHHLDVEVMEVQELQIQLWDLVIIGVQAAEAEVTVEAVTVEQAVAEAVEHITLEEMVEEALIILAEAEEHMHRHLEEAQEHILDQAAAVVDIILHLHLVVMELAE